MGTITIKLKFLKNKQGTWYLSKEGNPRPHDYIDIKKLVLQFTQKDIEEYRIS